MRAIRLTVRQWQVAAAIWPLLPVGEEDQLVYLDPFILAEQLDLRVAQVRSIILELVRKGVVGKRSYRRLYWRGQDQISVGFRVNSAGRVEGSLDQLALFTREAVLQQIQEEAKRCRLAHCPPARHMHRSDPPLLNGWDIHLALLAWPLLSETDERRVSVLDDVVGWGWDKGLGDNVGQLVKAGVLVLVPPAAYRRGTANVQILNGGCTGWYCANLDELTGWAEAAGLCHQNGLNQTTVALHRKLMNKLEAHLLANGGVTLE